jgi:RNA polymerase sigma-70 factor (ECF subfamily)
VAEDSRNSRLDLGRENSTRLPPPTAVTELNVSELFQAHAAFVARVVRRGGVAERDLHDAVQEVFLVVQRRLPEFEGRSQPRTWLYRIAWNVASETKRRAYRRRELLELSAEPAANAPGALEQLQECEQLRALRIAVDGLDPDKREALIHSEIEERPLNELAERRGIPLKTAFSRLYAARRALQQALRAQGWLVVPWWPELRQLGGRLVPRSSVMLPVVVVLGVLVGPNLPAVVQPSASEPPQLQVVRLEEVLPEVETAVVALAEPEPPRWRPRRSRSLTRFAPPSAAGEGAVPAMPAPPASPMGVVRTGAADLGLGPFGTSSLANPALVAPERHPRAKVVWGGKR